MADVNLLLILSAAFLSSASPGPATLAIAGTSMHRGRSAGLALAAGIMTGSLFWSLAAALGLGAVMFANAWAFEVLRYAGAAYLLFLALKSARSALRATTGAERMALSGSRRSLFLKGLALHLTNPKAVMSFGSLYAIGLGPGAPPVTLATVIAAVGLQSFVIFHGYALIFSDARILRLYLRLRRWFDSAFALAFGAAGFKVLTTRLQ
jgi:threonine efflux protein